MRDGSEAGGSRRAGQEPPSELPCRELFLSVMEEILGRKDSDLMSAEEAQNTLAFDRQTLLAGRTLHAEMSERMAGVPREWLSTKGLIRQPDGQVVGLFGIARDLSHHRRGEAAQRQSEALFRAAESSSFDAFLPRAGNGSRRVEFPRRCARVNPMTPERTPPHRPPMSP
jgi:PAS domain-containing protein